MKYSQAAFVSLLAVVVAGCSTLPIGHSSRSKVNVEDLFTSDESVITSNKAEAAPVNDTGLRISCLLYTSPSPRDLSTSRMPSSA